MIFLIIDDIMIDECKFVVVFVCGFDLLCVFWFGEMMLGNCDFVECMGLLKVMVNWFVYMLIVFGYLCYDEMFGKYVLDVGVLLFGYVLLLGFGMIDFVWLYM